jgi:hypothetical protein
MIKPPRKSRDQRTTSTFDENVTLADVGATLIEFFSEPPASRPDLPVISLGNVLRGGPTDSLDRPILVEGVGNQVDKPRFSIRWGHSLFLMDSVPLVYNSLIDRFETTPVKAAETASLQKEWQAVQNLFLAMKWPLWEGLSRDEIIKSKGLAEIWPLVSNPESPARFERLAHRLKDDAEVRDLYSRELLTTQNWTQLEKWALGLGASDLEAVALRNLRKEGGRRPFQNPCLALLDKNNPQPMDLKACENNLGSRLLEWIIDERTPYLDSNSKDAYRRRFLRLYLTHQMDQKILEVNYALSNIWDLSKDLVQQSLTVEMMLSLPELQKYRQITQRAFQQFRAD